MTPKPQETFPVEHSPDGGFQDETSNKAGYVNDAYLNNDLSMVPRLELSGDLKQQSTQQQQPQAKQIIDFDDLLPYIGEFGRYQKILFLMMIPFAFFVAFVYFSQIFITLVPDQYWCHVPELANLTVEQR